MFVEAKLLKNGKEFPCFLNTRYIVDIYHGDDPYEYVACTSNDAKLHEYVLSKKSVERILGEHE